MSEILTQVKQAARTIKQLHHIFMLSKTETYYANHLREPQHSFNHMFKILHTQ